MKHQTKELGYVSFRAATAVRRIRVLALLLTLGALGIVSTTSMGATELVSVNKEGTDSGSGKCTSPYCSWVGYSDNPVISADGRFVAFQSHANDLVATDTNGKDDVFVRDLQNGTTTLVSVNKDGTDSGMCTSCFWNVGSNNPVISTDGRFVAFESHADDLVATDTNGQSDVFVRDLQSGTTTLVSVNNDGTDSGTGYSANPKISADGRFVAFESSADDLVATDSNDAWDVFVRDLQNGTTTLVSVNQDGIESGSGNSGGHVISADGRFVAFGSEADDLVAADTNDATDVFVRDLQSATTTLVSVNKDGTDAGSRDSYGPVISADSRFVVFLSLASNLVATDTSHGWEVFMRDRQNGTTTLVSINKDGTGSGSGRYPYYAISADGRFVAFTSKADDLVDMDTNRYTTNVFVRDLQSRATTLISINKDGTSAGAGYSSRPAISADGRFVAFTSSADDLVATDTNGKGDVFVRDLQSATTTLVSANKDGTDSGSGWSRYPVINADDRFLVFVSEADDLVATDTNGKQDVFVSNVLQVLRGCDCDAPGAIKGTSGPDSLYGTEQADTICGLGGHDFIAGMDGDDCINGGEGDDWIYGGSGSDAIFGDAGKDVIYSDRGNDVVNGGDDDDYLFGGVGNDRLDGGEGFDWVFCGNGMDIGIGENLVKCEK